MTTEFSTTDDAIRNRFSFHPATDVTGEVHDEVRGECLALALRLNLLLPEGREKSLVFTKLEEAMHWANAAVAIQS